MSDVDRGAAGPAAPAIGREEQGEGIGAARDGEGDGPGAGDRREERRYFGRVHRRVTGAASDAAGDGLLGLDALAERVRRVGVLLQHLGIGRARRLALAEAGQRQAELEERVRRLAALRVGLVAGEELVGRLAILGAGEEALADPVLRVRQALVARDRRR